MRLSEDTCENCNSYNMLKLGLQLFLHDPGTAAYMDHYEWTLLNQMLAEQDPDSAHGYVTYYTGLWAGSQRQPKGGLGAAPGSYSSDYDNFSCDHGTALETQTKFADTIYAHREDTLYVNLFIPSQVTWTQRGVTLRQDTRYPDAERVRLTVVHGGGRFVLKVRIPGWLGEGGHGRRAVVTVAGQEARAEARPGSYLTLDRHWRTGDTVDITLPMDLTWRPAPDNPHVKALSYGPVVLAGAHGTAQSATIPAIEPASVRKSASVRGEFTARAEESRCRCCPSTVCTTSTTTSTSPHRRGPAPPARSPATSSTRAAGQTRPTARAPSRPPPWPKARTGPPDEARSTSTAWTAT